MALFLLFISVLLVAFGLVMLLTKPSQSELRLQARLSGIVREADGESYVPVDILKRDTFSDVPWLNTILSRLEPAARLRRLLAEADKNWSVGKLVSSSLLAGVVVVWFGRLVLPNPVTVGLLALLAVCGPVLYLLFARHQRFTKFIKLLPETLDLLARALKAGHSISSATEMVAQEIAEPVGPEFRRLFEEQNFGLPMRDALMNLTERVPLSDVRYLITAILIQRETGGNLVEVLEKTTSVLRQRIKLEGEIRVHTAQGRLTGWILCLLPVILFFGISIVNPHYSDLLLQDSLGRKLIVVGLILMCFGMVVIRKIVNIKV
ncbi:MAG: type II secretion system F family protein [Acidobacteriota bacterium]|nr:type II secretion system F family protein [Acidobacteriota bacterium]